MYTAFFANNKTYGADDINKVLAHLTTQGVSLFEDTGAPLMDLDTALANMVSTGVQVYDCSSCKVTALGNNKFKILKGCCWMPSGACVIFDDAGYTFESNFATSAGGTSTTCYVYLKQGGDEFDGASNDVYVVASGDAPTESDVLLATISSAGAVTDKRVVAVSKVAVPAENPVKTVSFTVNYNQYTELSNSNYYEYVYKLDSEYNQFGYVYNTLCNGNNWEDHYFYLVKLTSDWQVVTNYDYDYWLYARKTSECIELKIYGHTHPTLTVTVQLFLGEPL